MRRTTTLSLLLAVALMASACTDEGTSPSTSTTTAAPETTTTVAPGTTTTTQPPIDLNNLPGTEDLPESVRAELTSLAEITQQVRELNFITPPNVRVVDEAELERLVREQSAEDLEDLPVDEALYELLGLLAEGTDLEGLFSEVLGESVLGFYSFEDEELVVPMAEGGFSTLQRATLVHELAHALTDQVFDVYEKYSPMFDEQRYDQASSYQALLEGDASLAQVLYLQTLSQSELGEFVAEALQQDTSALESAPAFIRTSLEFPYDSGLTFVQELYTDGGGWEDVNDAYQRLVDLPGSSEQIITPEDYERDLPKEVALPTVTVPAGYVLEESSVWGELGFRIMFDEVMGSDETLTAADGWGGDAYSVWFDGTNAVLVLVYEGDTEGDRDEAEQALLEFARTSVPEPAFVWVEVLNGQLTFIAADEVPVGEAILAELGG
jgi:hypothetical protein